ncbi:hypothetical protein Tco_0209502 [Tanacetum coccineum]
MKVTKEESKILGLLMIDDDLFTCDTPLGTIFNEFNQLSRMVDELFTYDVEIHELSYSLSVKQQMDDLYNGNIDVYERKLCYYECEKKYAEAVIFIDKRLVRLIDVIVKKWFDLKYGDHTMVSDEIKENVIATWLIRSYKKKFEDYTEIKKQKETRGDDKKVITDDELSDLGNGNLIDETKIAKIFRIETDIFRFKTPLCKAFKEFNYLLKIDVDVLTNGISGFKSYGEYKDAWIYEWNKDVPWVSNMPWLDYRPWMEPNDALNSKAIFEGSKGVDEESSDNARTHCSPINKWEDFERATHIGADANSNYNPYLDVSRIFNDRARTNSDYETQGKHGWFDKHEFMGDDDDDIGDLEDLLDSKRPSLLRKIQGEKMQATWNSLRKTTNMQIKVVRGS